MTLLCRIDIIHNFIFFSNEWVALCLFLMERHAETAKTHNYFIYVDAKCRVRDLKSSVKRCIAEAERPRRVQSINHGGLDSKPDPDPHN
jgi:hypothetical protein